VYITSNNDCNIKDRSKYLQNSRTEIIYNQEIVTTASALEKAATKTLFLSEL